mgnify:CR=1 FL=1
MTQIVVYHLVPSEIQLTISSKAPGNISFGQALVDGNFKVCKSCAMGRSGVTANKKEKTYLYDLSIVIRLHVSIFHTHSPQYVLRPFR